MQKGSLFLQRIGYKRQMAHNLLINKSNLNGLSNVTMHICYLDKYFYLRKGLYNTKQIAKRFYIEINFGP